MFMNIIVMIHIHMLGVKQVVLSICDRLLSIPYAIQLREFIFLSPWLFLFVRSALHLQLLMNTGCILRKIRLWPADSSQYL